MVAMAKKARFALMNWKTRMGSLRSPVRTRPLPLPRYRAPGAVAGSHAADGSAPHARHWSGRHVGGLHRDRPVAPSSRSPRRSARTRAIAPLVFAQIGPDQPSVAGIPAHRVGDSSASMAPPSQVKGVHRTGSTPPSVFAWDKAANHKWLISGQGALIMNLPGAWAVAVRYAPAVAE